MTVNIVDTVGKYSVNSAYINMYQHSFLGKDMHNEVDSTEIAFEGSFDNDSSSFHTDNKKLTLRKMAAKRKLEEYLENRRIENEWSSY